MATHLVILASLASTLLALFGAGQAGALARLEHDNGDNRQAQDNLDNGEDQLEHTTTFLSSPAGQNHLVSPASPDVAIMIS